MLTIPWLPSSTPSLLPPFILGTPNLQGPSDPSPIYPAGCLPWDIAQTHHTHQVQNQVCYLSPKLSLSSIPISVSLPACYPGQTPGAHARHLPLVSLQSPWCPLPNSPPVTPFLTYPLGPVTAVRPSARHRLLELGSDHAGSLCRELSSGAGGPWERAVTFQGGKRSGGEQAVGLR